jgi:hypothetical protein
VPASGRQIVSVPNVAPPSRRTYVPSREIWCYPGIGSMRAPSEVAVSKWRSGGPTPARCILYTASREYPSWHDARTRS